MSNNRQRHNLWSNLPGEIIQKISKHLNTRQQMLRFKSVCRKWRKHSLPFPSNILSLTLPLPIPIPIPISIPFHNSTNPLILQVSSIYMITPYHSSVSPVSLHPWMIMAQESNPGKIQLCHSLTGIRVKNFPLSLNLTQFRVSKLTQGYNFKLSDNIHKIILCSSTSPSLIEVIVLYGKGTLVKLTARILESRAHEEEEEEEGCSWKKLKVRKSRQFWFHCLDDVVEYKKMVCAIDRNGKLYVLDTKAMYVERVLVSDPVYKGLPNCRRKRLVVDCTSEELYMVVREHMMVEVGFTIYKFNVESKRWDVVVKVLI